MSKNFRVIIGTHAIQELVKIRPNTVSQIWVSEDWRRNQELSSIANHISNPDRVFQQKPTALLDRWGNHQGAVAFADFLPSWDLDSLNLSPTKKASLLFLDGLTDPHNLGAILRTAWLMGVQAVILSADRSVGLTPSVHKVACGGVEHVPILQVTQLGVVSETLQKAGFWIFGLSHDSKDHLFSKKLPDKLVWVIGNEEKGIRTSTRNECDELIRIPQIDAAASYNASVATALALSETFRQHNF